MVVICASSSTNSCNVQIFLLPSGAQAVSDRHIFPSHVVFIENAFSSHGKFVFEIGTQILIHKPEILQHLKRVNRLPDLPVMLPHLLCIWPIRTTDDIFFSVLNRQSGLILMGNLTFHWSLWRAHWFLCDSLDLYRNISGKQVPLAFALLMWAVKSFSFIHMVFSLPQSYHRAVMTRKFGISTKLLSMIKKS